MSGIVVIGAGIAGLVAANLLRDAGADVTLVTKGVGGLQLGQGSVDVLGYAPDRVTRPYDAIAGWVGQHPQHPYATFGPDAVRAGVEAFQQLVPDLVGDGQENLLLPTAVGALRPTLLAPKGIAAGALTADDRAVVAGPRQLKDFYPALMAANLASQLGIDVRPVSFDLSPRGEADTTGLTYARALDDPAERERLAEALRPELGDATVVLLPAFVGLYNPDAHADLEARLGCRVGEIPLPPPGVPGMRINQHLTLRARRERVRVVNGSKVLGARTEGDRITGITINTAGSPRTIPCSEVILAPGGFESGALTLDSYGVVHETLLGLPVRLPDVTELVTADAEGEQPLFLAGLAVDDQCRVLNGDGDVVHPNLRAAGGVIAGAIRWREKSGEGIALATAVRAATSILEEAR